MKKKAVSLMIILCLVITGVVSGGLTVSAQDVAIAPDSAADYHLAQTCQDGNILQCFCWTLNQIKAELPNIAEAGFTCVQTSPLQTHSGSNQWYWLYQPNGFTLGNELGSYSDLQSLCTEADKYGIKIIVDVVANHVAGSDNGNLANSVESVFKNNKSTYFHNRGKITDYYNRTQITQYNLGMPDLNSENTAIQDMAAAMIVRLKEAGVDGIRWDAAKHIALPSENCAFWSRMAQIDIYQYGEILGNPESENGTAKDTELMQEYAQYLSVTDAIYSGNIMRAVRDGAKHGSEGYWTKEGVSASKIVYWGESHDTFANDVNDGGETKNLDQKVIDKAYAILGARANSHALYLSRPSEKNKTSIYYARKGSTHFTSPEVAAVNHFHNAMIGTAEKYISSTKYYAVLRGGGAVIASNTEDTDISVANSNATVPEGTYIDEVSGNTFTVTASRITGHVGTTGIVVLYNGTPPEEEILIGDADDDGEVTILDATFIQRYEAGIALPSPINTKNADADKDEEVTIIDATLVQRRLAGIISRFPAEE